MPRPSILVTERRSDGFELVRLFAPLGEIIAADRAMLDLARSDASSCPCAVLSRAIVNDGAYTAVDRAEAIRPRTSSNTLRQAFLRNKRARFRLLIHYSNDYVSTNARRRTEARPRAEP